MARRSAVLVTLAAAVLLVACGGAAQRAGTATPAPPAVAPTPGPAGAACVPSVRDEFVRQQALVAWDVYCPSSLPDGFRLARPGDPRAAPYLQQDYTPTVDDLNPGGGTFVTRLIGPDGQDLMIIQGAGASIFTRHTAAGPPETESAEAPFGDIGGFLFTDDPPAVAAFDSRAFGHMVTGYGVTADEVARIAAAMRPVDPSGPHRALLVPLDLHSIDERWVYAWTDPTGEDVASPAVCGAAVDAGPRVATGGERFEPAPEPGAPPDAAGHGPFFQQAVIRFESDAAAMAYLKRVRQAAVSCAPYTPSAGVSVTVTPLDAPPLADEAVAYRRSSRSPVQGLDTDVLLLRAGPLVTVLLYARLARAGSAPVPVDLTPYAERAAALLEQLASPHP